MKSTTELSRDLATRTGISLASARQQVDIVFELIADEMRNGGAVRIHGFGTFKATERKARKAHDPRTGDIIDVPAARLMKLSMARALKTSLNPVSETRERRRA